jgi:hypothetical protein
LGQLLGYLENEGVVLFKILNNECSGNSTEGIGFFNISKFSENEFWFIFHQYFVFQVLQHLFYEDLEVLLGDYCSGDLLDYCLAERFT